MEENIKEFRDGIFALRTRRLGVVAEYMIKYLLYNCKFSHTKEYDLISANNKRIEVKFSLCLKKHNEKITNKNIIKQCQNSKLDLLCLSSSDIENDKNKFDCNIQQVKPKLFDILFYGIFFTDKIEIFRIDSTKAKEILSQKEFSASKNQHFGNKGEGQFHINNKTYKKHKDNKKGFFVQSLTYEELFALLKLHEND